MDSGLKSCIFDRDFSARQGRLGVLGLDKTTRFPKNMMYLVKENTGHTELWRRFRVARIDITERDRQMSIV